MKNEKTKSCSTCKVVRSFTEFSKNRWRPDGLCHRCKSCVKSYSDQNREHINSKQNTYYTLNKEKIIKYQTSYEKKRKLTDVNFKLKCVLRGRLNKALKNNYKKGSSVTNLGCSIDEFKIYLESLFTDGMSWENYGKGMDRWTIDHIKPLAKFNLQVMEEFVAACHYTNLQPLWTIDNLKKGAK